MRRVLAGMYEAEASAESSLGRLAAALVEDGAAERLQLGSVRLAFTGGPIPESACPYLCLVDGVVDNLAEIAAELRLEGPLEATLAVGYARWGRDLLERLRGRFALVVVDRNGDEALLAVDQLGSHPLFTAEQGNRPFWASEIRNLLHLLPRQPAPDRLALTAWLGGTPLPPERTLYEGVFRVPGGHAVSIRAGHLDVSRYWSPRYVRPQRVGREELVPALREEIVAAVRRQSVPGRTGILMSGGLDSTAVAGIATRLVGADPHAYSAVFPGRTEVDESSLLEAVTRHLEIPWTRLEITNGSALREILEFLSAWRLPSPSPNLYFHLALGSRAAADGLAVLLDGEGGDELFGCVPYLIADRLRSGRLVGAVSLIRSLPWNGKQQPWRAVRPFLREFGFRGAVPHRVHLLSGALRPERPFGPPWLSAESRQLLGEVRDLWPWKRLSGPLWWRYLANALTSAREQVGIHDFLRRASELGGAERRHPFLDDLRLIEFMLRVPPELAFDSRHSRPALREAVAGIVPDSVRLRPQKATFTDVIGECLAGPERDDVARLVTGPDTEVRALLAPGAVEEVLAKLTDPRHPGYAGAMFRMVSAECWLRSQADPGFADRLLEQGDLPRGRYRIVGPQSAAVTA